MIGNKTISLVVPCKNEAGIIADFIRRVPSYVDEIIIVDNNSTDTTAAIAKKEGAIVIKEPRMVDGIGYGYAHMAGLKHATGDYIVAMDGDDTYPVSKIKTIVRFLEQKNLDMISCNRLPLIHPKAISWIRQLGIRILNIETFLFYGYPISDILTGMWIVTKEAAKTLSIQSGDWNFSPEIKLAALINPDIRFAEYHINHFERVNEVSKQKLFKTGIGHAFFIMKYRFATLVKTRRVLFNNISVVTKNV